MSWGIELVSANEVSKMREFAHKERAQKLSPSFEHVTTCFLHSALYPVIASTILAYTISACCLLSGEKRA